MSKTKQQARVRARELAAARKRAEERRKRFLLAGSAVGAVVLVVAVLVAVKLAAKPPAPAAQSGAASQSVVAAATGVPAATLDAIGRGSGLQGTPKQLTGRPVLKADGKPLVLYIGADYCPYCAVQRWSLVEALARFGTFSGLGQTTSSASDVYPNTPSLSFHGATYTSKYLTFQGVEMYTNQPAAGGGYTVLDTPTAQQSALLAKDGNNSFPFIDLGDQATVTSVMVDPTLLTGKTHQQIAAAMSDANSPIGQAFGGSANAFTAILCKLTGGQPGAVCTSKAAQAYAGDYSGQG